MIRRLVPRHARRGWGRVIQIGGGLGLQPGADLPALQRHPRRPPQPHGLPGPRAEGHRDYLQHRRPRRHPDRQCPAFLTDLAPARGWGETWQEIERNAIAELVPNDAVRADGPCRGDRRRRPLSQRPARRLCHRHHSCGVDGGTVRRVHPGPPSGNRPPSSEGTSPAAPCEEAPRKAAPTGYGARYRDGLHGTRFSRSGKPTIAVAPAVQQDLVVG